MVISVYKNGEFVGNGLAITGFVDCDGETLNVVYLNNQLVEFLTHKYYGPMHSITVTTEQISVLAEYINCEEWNAQLKSESPTEEIRFSV